MIIKFISLGLALFLVPTNPLENNFPFPTIENLLEENQRFKEENKWLNDIIAKNISDLAEQITLVRNENINNIAARIKNDLTLDVPIGKTVIWFRIK